MIWFDLNGRTIIYFEKISHDGLNFSSKIGSVITYTYPLVLVLSKVATLRSALTSEIRKDASETSV